MLKITLSHGTVGKKETQKKVLQALGLRKFGSTVIRANSPTIAGMIDKVAHLVTVCEVSEGTRCGRLSRKQKRQCQIEAKSRIS